MVPWGQIASIQIPAVPRSGFMFSLPRLTSSLVLTLPWAVGVNRSFFAGVIGKTHPEGVKTSHQQVTAAASQHETGTGLVVQNVPLHSSTQCPRAPLSSSHEGRVPHAVFRPFLLRVSTR